MEALSNQRTRLAAFLAAAGLALPLGALAQSVSGGVYGIPAPPPVVTVPPPPVVVVPPPPAPPPHVPPVSPPPPVQLTIPFHDVSPHAWYASDVAIVVHAGLIGGFPGGAFHPNQQATGAEFVAVVIRLLGLTPLAEQNKGKTWYHGYAVAAQKLGLISSTAGITKPVDRLQAFVILAKALKLKPVTNVKLPFKDLAKVPADLRGYIIALYEKGYIAGISKTSLGLSRPLSRAQMVALIARLLQLTAKA